MRIGFIRTFFVSLLSLAALAFSGCGFPAPPSLSEPVSITVGAYTAAANVGALVTLSATVSNPLATGTVTFYNGSTQIGTAAVTNAFPADFAFAQLSTTFSSPVATRTYFRAASAFGSKTWTPRRPKRVAP